MTEYNSVIKVESIINHVVSEVSQITPNYKIMFYEPDLKLFNMHVFNHYIELTQHCLRDDLLFISPDTWKNYCEGVLRVMLHTLNNKLYKLGGGRTDSVLKILRNTLGDSKVPRWLIDLCREVARPMAQGCNIFVPYMSVNPHLVGSDDRMYWLGIGIAQATSVSTIMCLIDKELGWEEIFECRQVVEEDVVIAPLCVNDGATMFIDPCTATWRREAFYYLRSFVNGCNVPDMELGSSSQNAWCVERGSFATNAYWFNLNLVDSTEPPDAKQVSVGNEIDVLRAIQLGSYYVPPGTSMRPQLWLFYMNERNVIYNDWFLRGSCPNATLPNLLQINTVVRRLMAIQARFPSEDKYSKSPLRRDPQHTVRTDHISSVRKRKARQNAKVDVQQLDSIATATQ